MISGSAVVWYFIILPTIESGAGPIKTALSAAYIVGDLVSLLGITTILLRRPPEPIRKPLYLLVAGLVNLLFADVIFAFVTLHNLGGSGALVVLWATSGLLLSAASLYQFYLADVSPVIEAEIQAEVYTPTFSWIPYAAIVVGYAVLVYSALPYWNQPHGIIVLTALFLTAIVVLRQITAVKENIRLHAAEAARESELHFRTLIENSSDIVMIFNRAGQITYQSPSVERILGYCQDSLIGCSALDYIHKDDVKAMMDAWKALSKNRQTEVMRECRFLHFDGIVACDRGNCKDHHRR